MSISIEQQIGQLIIAGFRGMEVDPESNIAKYIQEYNIGGVILYCLLYTSDAADE